MPAELQPPDGRWAWTRERVRRHWRWGRTQGWARLIEEDQLNPVTRARTAHAKRRWRRAHGHPPGAATAVYVVGLQRSGTNMVLRGLESAPETEVYNENNGHAFERFQLRSNDAVRNLVARSEHAVVLFKPLCDSHRTLELLGIGGGGASRAVWVYRDVDARTRSALAKFGNHSQDVLAAIAAGDVAGRWQAGGLDDEILTTVRELDPATLGPESAAALLWYLRNRLIFSLGLDERDDVRLVSYDRFVAEPAPLMEELCEFLDVKYRSLLVAHVAERTDPSAGRLDLHPRVRVLCDELSERLAASRCSAPGR